MAATPARAHVQEPLLECKGQQSPVAGASANPAQDVERLKETQDVVQHAVGVSVSAELSPSSH